MLAYHNDQKIKDAILVQLAAHAKADEIVKGQYWQDGKGCAVGCTIHSGRHAEYESHFGIPQALARLEDTIFEGLPNGKAKAWPVIFMSAIKPGQDLSRVGWQFLHWLLTDKTINPGIDHPLVCEAIQQCAAVLLPLAKGESITKGADSAARSAERAANTAWSAARSAWSAAWSAASAARAASAAWSATRSAARADSAARSAARADSAARSAESAARSVESAAWSSESAAWSAARSAARSVESAARSADSAATAAYVKMSSKLIELLEAA